MYTMGHLLSIFKKANSLVSVWFFTLMLPDVTRFCPLVISCRKSAGRRTYLPVISPCRFSQ